MKSRFRRLSDRQRLFCRYVAEGCYQSLAALKAGYSRNGNRSRASRLMKRQEIKEEIKRLQDEIASPLIASLMERKKILSEIARANMADYFETVGGQQVLKLNKKIPNAIIQVTTKTKTDKRGNTITRTSIKMADKIRAINELNKMDGAYPAVSKSNKRVSRQEAMDELERQKQLSIEARKKFLHALEKLDKTEIESGNQLEQS